MKKSVIAIIGIFFSVNVFATCTEMMNETDIANFYFKANYCDGDLTKIILKNSNKYLNDYTADLTKNEFTELINAYKKSLEWYKKAKDMKVNINKSISITNTLKLNFRSDNNGDKITVLLMGIKDRTHSGGFGMRKQEKIEDIISKLESIKNNGPKKLKDLENSFS